MGVAMGAGALATAGARVLVRSGWKYATGNDSPENPAARKTSWREAMLWAGVSGLVIGVAHVFAERGAAAGWKRWQGELPPGL